jgi:hypothetical protein
MQIAEMALQVSPMFCDFFIFVSPVPRAFDVNQGLTAVTGLIFIVGYSLSLLKIVSQSIVETVLPNTSAAAGPIVHVDGDSHWV